MKDHFPLTAYKLSRMVRHEDWHHSGSVGSDTVRFVSVITLGPGKRLHVTLDFIRDASSTAGRHFQKMRLTANVVEAAEGARFGWLHRPMAASAFGLPAAEGLRVLRGGLRLIEIDYKQLIPAALMLAADPIPEDGHEDATGDS